MWSGAGAAKLKRIPKLKKPINELTFYSNCQQTPSLKMIRFGKFVSCRHERNELKKGITRFMICYLNISHVHSSISVGFRLSFQIINAIPATADVPIIPFHPFSRFRNSCAHKSYVMLMPDAAQSAIWISSICKHKMTINNRHANNTKDVQKEVKQNDSRRKNAVPCTVCWWNK